MRYNVQFILLVYNRTLHVASTVWKAKPGISLALFATYILGEEVFRTQNYTDKNILIALVSVTKQNYFVSTEQTTNE